MLRGSALVDIINRIEEIEADEGVRQQFRELVQQVGAEHGFSLQDRTGRALFARKLLNAGVSRPTIRDRLMWQFGISRAQAYREIEAALQLSHLRPVFGTPQESNQTMEIRSGDGNA